MTFRERIGRLAWWRRDDDPAARARQALAAMRAEQPNGSRALWVNGGYVAADATDYDCGGSAGGSGSD